MRKFYSFIMLTIMLMVGYVAKAATASVYVDDRSLVILYVNGDNWDQVDDKLVSGEFVDIDFTPGLTWNIDTYKDGSVLSKLVINGETVVANEKLTFDVGYDFAVQDGDVVEIYMHEQAATDPTAAVASVYIDDKTGVYLYVNGDEWDQVQDQLVNGKFVDIEFTPGLTWNIDNQKSGTVMSKLVINDVTVAENQTIIYDEGYTFSVKNGDKVEIFMLGASTPTTNAVITVDYGKAGADAVKKITVDGKDVEVVDGKFEAKKGDQLIVYTDNANYKFNSVKLGATELNYIVATGVYVGTVEGDATLTIDAEAKQDLSVKANISDAEAVTLYLSDSQYNTGTAIEGIVNGDNTLTIPASTPILEVKAADGYKITSAKYTDADGATKDMSYDSYNAYYYVNVEANKVVSVDVVAEEVVIEYVKFTVNIENVAGLKDYFIRTNSTPRVFLADSDDASKLLKDGDNEFTITSEQAASVRLDLTFVGTPGSVLINDVPAKGIKAGGDNNIWGDITIADGDKIVITGTSAIADIITSINGDNKVYNLQGVEVKCNNLPAGIYIINGTKTIVR